MEKLIITEPEEGRKVFSVQVTESSDFLDPGTKRVTFFVRMPWDGYVQSVLVSTMECEELLDRLWDIIKQEIMKYYREKQTAQDSE